MVIVRSSPCTPSGEAKVCGRKCVSTPSHRPRTHLPAGDSPYAQAKRVQLVDRDPDKAVSLFWTAINNGDRVDSALADMALVMKQLNRPQEAIEAIRSFRHLCSKQAQEALDNVLVDLYKRCGRVEDQIELLTLKLRLIDKGLVFSRTKQARPRRKGFYVSTEQEKARLLGNLAWAYLKVENYKEAELHYRKALEIEPDYNKQSNLAICLMQTGRIMEAKYLIKEIREASINCNTESFSKSFKRASEMLSVLESKSSSNGKIEDKEAETNDNLPSATSLHGRPPCLATKTDNRKIEVLFENLTTSYLFYGTETPSPVVRWKKESANQVNSSPYFRNTPSRYFTPPSGISKETVSDGLSVKEAPISTQNRRCQSPKEAFFTPKSVNRCLEIESKEKWVGPISSVSRHQYQGRNYKKSTAQHREKDDTAEDTRLKPGLAVPSSASLRNNLPARAWKRRETRRINVERSNEESYGSYSSSDADAGSLKPPTPDPFVEGCTRSTRAVNEIKVGSNEETGSYLKSCADDATAESCGTQLDAAKPKIPSQLPISIGAFQQGITFGRLMYDPVQNYLVIPSSVSDKGYSKRDTSEKSIGRKRWADMAEEEVNKDSIESHFHYMDLLQGQKLSSIRRERKSWADMEEEEESLATEANEVSLESHVHSVDSLQEQKLLVIRNERKSWADMVEEEESLATEGLNNAAVSKNTRKILGDSTEEHVNRPPCPEAFSYKIVTNRMNRLARRSLSFGQQ